MKINGEEVTLEQLDQIVPNGKGFIITPLGNWVKLGNWVELGDGVELGNWVKLGNWVELGNGDYIHIHPIGSRNARLFIHKHNGVLYAQTGCFSSTVDEFLANVQETHKDNEHAQAYRLAVELAKLRIGRTK